MLFRERTVFNMNKLDELMVLAQKQEKRSKKNAKTQ